MTQPNPMAGPGFFSAAGALNDVTLQVNPANVLAVRAAILTEADRLDRVLEQNLAQAVVRDCGGDPVSPEAAKAFNERIRDLGTQCQLYNDELRASGNVLTEIARSYGLTEEQIAASFKAGR